MMQTPQAQILNPSLNVTTEQIQKYLDENKQLIMIILENQNMGKFAECASYQAKLQQNLTYLAKIADTQSQEMAMPYQMPAQSAVKQEHYVQSSQMAMSHQPMCLAPKPAFQISDQQQLPHLQQQQFT